MNPQQRATAERLVDGPRTSDELWRRAVISFLRELLAEPQGEPVVYTTKSQLAAMANQHQRYVNAVDAKFAEAFGIGSDKVPLYANPPQQRKQISDEVVAKLINAEWATSDVPSAWKFARAIERAITGEPT
ncbi:MAG: hypothetical protein IPN11_14420 [Opitutaceae bacterium]|nr:hypothetical protein [Opitutaceae bacterium]